MKKPRTDRGATAELEAPATPRPSLLLLPSAVVAHALTHLSMREQARLAPTCRGLQAQAGRQAALPPIVELESAWCQRTDFGGYIVIDDGYTWDKDVAPVQRRIASLGARCTLRVWCCKWSAEVLRVLEHRRVDTLPHMTLLNVETDADCTYTLPAVVRARCSHLMIQLGTTLSMPADSWMQGASCLSLSVFVRGEQNTLAFLQGCTKLTTLRLGPLTDATSLESLAEDVLPRLHSLKMAMEMEDTGPAPLYTRLVPALRMCALREVNVSGKWREIASLVALPPLLERASVGIRCREAFCFAGSPAAGRTLQQVRISRLRVTTHSLASLCAFFVDNGDRVCALTLDCCDVAPPLDLRRALAPMQAALASVRIVEYPRLDGKMPAEWAAVVALARVPPAAPASSFTVSHFCKTFERDGEAETQLA